MAVMKAARGVLLALLCVGFTAFAFAPAALAEVAVPALTGRVVDRTGTLPSGQIATLDATLKAFEDRKGSQVAVLIVPTTAPETIEQFSLRVAEQWKIGRKKVDDGAILLVAKDDRALRIEVGYGLEGALNDVTAKRIIDEIIVPRFRAGDFAGGVSAGVDRILKVIDGEPLPAPKPQRTDAYDGVDPFNPFLIVGVLVLGGILRGVLGRLMGSLVTGGLAAAAAWFLLGTLTMSLIAGVVAFVFTLVSDSLMGSGIGRGGFGGGFGGGSMSGGSGGGFGGGGGSFGGGGASGRW